MVVDLSRVSLLIKDFTRWTQDLGNVEGHLQVLITIWSSPDLDNFRGTGRLYVP